VGDAVVAAPPARGASPLGRAASALARGSPPPPGAAIPLATPPSPLRRGPAPLPRGAAPPGRGTGPLERETGPLARGPAALARGVIPLAGGMTSKQRFNFQRPGRIKAQAPSFTKAPVHALCSFYEQKPDRNPESKCPAAGISSRLDRLESPLQDTEIVRISCLDAQLPARDPLLRRTAKKRQERNSCEGERLLYLIGSTVIRGAARESRL
jgi:hypothetical protein